MQKDHFTISELLENRALSRFKMKLNSTGSTLIPHKPLTKEFLKVSTYKNIKVT